MRLHFILYQLLNQLSQCYEQVIPTHDQTLFPYDDGYYIDLTDKSINFIGHLRKKLERKIYKPDVHKIIMDSIECSMFIFNSNDKRTM